jgi:putative heme-binding domain-containing protein
VLNIPKALLFTIISTSMMASTSLAKKTHSTRTGPLTPEEQLKTFKLPEGYVIELVASEADGIVNPIDMSFDDAGRLWTQTGRMYPLDPVKNIKWNELLKLMDDPEAQKKDTEFKRVLDLYQGKTKGSDQVIIISDIYGDKEPETSVFADGLAIPQSILPYKSGAFVAQGSELFYLDDTDNDGKADKRTPVLTGFGFTDTHTMAHTLVRGPGGWIHFSQGALNKGEVTAVKSGAKTRFDYSKIGRFSIDGEKLEVVSSGLNNIWGFWLRPNGQWWGTEANDFGLSITPMEPGTGFKGIGNQKIRPYQPEFPILHKFRVGGTGISGLAFSDDESGGFPDQWENVAFLANPITNTINTVQITRNDDGTVTANHLPDFLTCQDDWFRPVNIEFGPDGCLYIADWYNKIVSHNEVPTAHPDRDKKHGRIWRIRYEGAPKRSIPDLHNTEPKNLINHLSSPFAWEKRSAVNQIIDRNLKQLSAPLMKLAGDTSASEQSRIHALWALEGIGHYEASLMDQLLKSELSDLRREAVRSMGNLAPDLETLNKTLAVSVNDPNPMVRSETLRTIADRGEANAGTIDILVTASKPEIPGSQLGGPYERKFERYLARMALENYPSPLIDYISSPLASKQHRSHLLWASQALPDEQRNREFLNIWGNKSADSKLDESTFIVIADMLHVPEIAKTVTPVLQNPAHGPTYVKYTIQHQSQVQSANLARILSPVLENMLTDPAQQLLALDAIARLKSPVQSTSIAKLLDGPAKPEIAKAALKALQADPKQNLPAITELARSDSLLFETRLSAVHTLYQISPQQGETDVNSMLKTLAPDEKSKLVAEFSGSKPGSDLLIKKFMDQTLPVSTFNLASAERMLQFNRKNPAAKKIHAEVRANDAREEQELASRIEHMMKIPEQLKGDPKTGRTLFNTCLMCHKVGEQGFDIAPALDGSAHRDREALLTAILDPDVAVESGYQVFRVRKKDDTTLEGYLSKDDETGVTLAFMGGSTVFIPAAEIASKGFAGGRSFMPKGLINGYSDQNVADLLAYIATLK